ncbi:hypothetical protein MVES_003040 [Malassezia vespertilionis]|uniref:Ribosomal eL28/Mak16 domain-containing protein n=1 Tax=Malassezia vespertilionis TaxID=2020962 RepID=A0A2N1J9R6_9BASI|nr:hypothetical protein MVES_003040 [Malassezia vespertilionis]
MSTQDLQWLLIRKTNSNIVKQKGLGRVFTRETGNVSALHNYKCSSLVNDKSVSIVPAKDGKGVLVATHKSKANPRAIKNTYNVHHVQGGARRVAGAVANIVAKSGYRPDLRKASVARATAIVNAQRCAVREPRQRAPRGAAARKAAAAAEQ